MYKSRTSTSLSLSKSLSPFIFNSQEDDGDFLDGSGIAYSRSTTGTEDSALDSLHGDSQKTHESVEANPDNDLEEVDLKAQTIYSLYPLYAEKQTLQNIRSELKILHKESKSENTKSLIRKLRRGLKTGHFDLNKKQRRAIQENKAIMDVFGTAFTPLKIRKLLKNKILIDLINLELEEAVAIETGTYGKVFSVPYVNDQKRTEPICAIKLKIQQNEQRIKRAARRQFKNEIALLRSLDHQNIVKIISVLLPHQCFSMELALADLHDVILMRANLATDPPVTLSLNECYLEKLLSQIPAYELQFTIDAAKGLAYLHEQNIIHGDVKLENILLVPKGRSLQVKLTDFGNSTRLDNKEAKVLSLGTIAYSAPELFRSELNKKSDIYSLGVVLWALLHEITPNDELNRIFERHKIGAEEMPIFVSILRSEGRTFKVDSVIVSRRTTKLLKKSWKKNPEERYSAKQFIAHAEKLLQLSQTDLPLEKLTNIPLLLGYFNNPKSWRTLNKQEKKLLPIVYKCLQTDFSQLTYTQRTQIKQCEPIRVILTSLLPAEILDDAHIIDPKIDFTLLSQVPLIEPHGSGASANVYTLNLPKKSLQRKAKKIAVKELKFWSNSSEYNLRRREKFRAEYKLMAELDHDNIVKLISVIIPEQAIAMMFSPYTVHDLLSLLNTMKKDTSDTSLQLYKKLNVKTIKKIMLELASALIYLEEQRVIHCDIKPENLLLHVVKKQLTLQVCDFDLSKKLPQDSDSTIHGSLLGTPDYMAPEIFDDKFSSAIDVYSTTLVLWSLVHGTLLNHYNDEKHNPDQSLSNEKLTQSIFTATERGHRPEIAATTPENVATLLESGWHQDPEARLTAFNFFEHIEALPAIDLCPEKLKTSNNCFSK